jgi:hypothetical protein
VSHHGCLHGHLWCRTNAKGREKLYLTAQEGMRRNWQREIASTRRIRSLWDHQLQGRPGRSSLANRASPNYYQNAGRFGLRSVLPIANWRVDYTKIGKAQGYARGYMSSKLNLYHSNRDLTPCTFEIRYQEKLKVSYISLGRGGNKPFQVGMLA